jgi:macrolide transport system ATP-binding/permease protein
MKHSALSLEDVAFSYKLGAQEVPALRGISLDIFEGEMVAIQGPSGSGKSTLLYMLGCMLRPGRGVIRVLGQDISTLNETELAYFRNRRLGFVFQQFHLLPGTDVLHNILLPGHYPLEEGTGEDLTSRARTLAQKLGLGERLDHKPAELSGGQQQRVAIARALIRDAPLILADEPTGNLDSNTSKEILKLLRELNAQGKTVIIITHDNEVAKACDRIIWIRDGRVVNQEDRKLEARTSAGARLKIPKLSRLGLAALVRESMPRAWENLKRNRLRSLLTMLGVVVGVASILAMLTLGTFTKEKILSSYATLGVNTLMFFADPNYMLKAVDRPPNPFQSLDLERDVAPISKVFPEIRAISPWYMSYRHSAIYGGRSVGEDVSVIGINEKGLGITRRELALGTGILPYHVENKSSVCVIGFELAQKLFLRQNPLGQAIQVAFDGMTFSCLVIGVSRPVFSRSNWGKPDLQVVVPYTFFLTLPLYSYYRQLRDIVLEVNAEADVEQAGKKLTAFFTKRYGRSGNFRASNDSVLVSQMRRFLDLFTMLLVSIAALSLIVGGMGITNMMLVSVNERLREIGLRKALGASHTAIRQLFFAEALFLCALAGVFGIAVGFAGYELLIYLGSKLIPDLEFQWVFNPLALGISFVAIVITGVLSGLGPAIRAEKLQVIEALRSE